ncbi:MAG: phosphate ABC transporter substrate-binding protein PstS [Deltaproteobacteria bacterium]|nr:phosphate ABC transporter substrate-binding protein PstS [Deltaproteobacteria bacterium]
MKYAQLLLPFIAVFALGCEKSAPVGEKAATLHLATIASEEPIDLQGAGATFPYPLYSKWIAEFQKVDPRVRINYQSIGSGGGIRQIVERTVDFGASDATMSDEELAKTPGKLLHIPMTLGAVVVTFNLPEVAQLRLSRQLVAAIFLGEIKEWNDPRLAKLNPGARLPAKPLTVVYRSDGSGTTAVFTEYLSSISAAWKERVGAGKSVKFPVGLGAKGNEGVAGQIKTSAATIGYVELAYAKQTALSYAAIENRAGNFIEPELKTITASAASTAGEMPDDLRLSIVDAVGADAYPIAAYSYILVYQNQRDALKGKALARFLWWAVHEGQRFGPSLHYAPLPVEAVSKIERKLRSLSYKGTSLLDDKK